LVDVISQAFFADDTAAVPPVTLRSGNLIDDYRQRVAFDPRWIPFRIRILSSTPGEFLTWIRTRGVTTCRSSWNTRYGICPTLTSLSTPY
jgi:hypothetical protein